MASSIRDYAEASATQSRQDLRVGGGGNVVSVSTFVAGGIRSRCRFALIGRGSGSLVEAEALTAMTATEFSQPRVIIRIPLWSAFVVAAVTVGVAAERVDAQPIQGYQILWRERPIRLDRPELWAKRDREVTAMSCTATEKSLALRAAIDQAYTDLSAAGIGKSNPNGIDITAQVRSVLPDGLSFDRAEKILRCAGFDVHRRPGPNPPGNRPDRFDVYAESRALLPQSVFVSRVVIITLKPHSPESYETVKQVRARILIIAP